MTEEIVQKANKCVQTVMYNGKLSNNYVSTREGLYENLKTKLSMSFPWEPDPHVKEIKRHHLQCYVWVNDVKAVLPSLNIPIYGWKVRGNDNIVPKWFSGNQLR